MPQPFSFRLTVRKPAGWHWAALEEVYGDGVLYTAVRVGQPVGLRLSSTKGGVRAEVFAADRLSADKLDRLGSRLKSGLGANEDLAGFYRAAERFDPFVRLAIEHLYGMRVGFAFDVFEAALLAICLQMAPLQRSMQMMRRLVSTYGEQLAFDGKTIGLWPSPSALASVSESHLKSSCGLGYRAKYVLGAARIVADGFPIEELPDLPRDEGVRLVRQLPGVGEYSADIILSRGGTPIDAWSAVVFHELFFGETPPKPRAVTPKVKEEARRRYGPWTWEVFAYVANDLPALAEAFGLSRVE